MIGQSFIYDQPTLTEFRDGSLQGYYYEADLTKALGEGTCYNVTTEKNIKMYCSCNLFTKE